MRQFEKKERPRLRNDRKFQRLKVPTSGSVPELVRRFFLIAKAKKISIERVAIATGYSDGTIYHWKKRCLTGPSVVVLDTCLRTLGFRLAIVPLDAQEHPATLAKIFEAERGVTKCPPCGSGRLPHVETQGNWRQQKLARLKRAGAGRAA